MQKQKKTGIGHNKQFGKSLSIHFLDLGFIWLHFTPVNEVSTKQK